MTATLDRITNGRLLINVVTGGDPVENKGDGIFLGHDERYEVTREFLSVYSDLLSGKTVDVEVVGKVVDYCKIEGCPAALCTERSQQRGS